jgi:hypothetical protein
MQCGVGLLALLSGSVASLILGSEGLDSVREVESLFALGNGQSDGFKSFAPEINLVAFVWQSVNPRNLGPQGSRVEKYLSSGGRLQTISSVAL